ncbi:hypothetical protein D3C87_1374440 [compost metagenome]
MVTLSDEPTVVVDIAAGSASVGAAMPVNSAEANVAGVAPGVAGVPGVAASLSPPQPASRETEPRPSGSIGAPARSFRALRRDALSLSNIFSSFFVWVGNRMARLAMSPQWERPLIVQAGRHPMNGL